MDEFDEIVEEFLVESRENLDRLDAELVRLEQEPFDVEVLAGIFRDIHTIKGAAGFLGMATMEKVAHAGENLLARLRDRELEVTAERTTVLLRMVDTIRELLDAVEASGEEPPGDHTDLVEALARLNRDDSAAAAPAEDAPAASTEEPVESVQPAESVATDEPVEAVETVEPVQSAAEEAPTAEPTVAETDDDADTTEASEADEELPRIGEILRENVGVSELDIETAAAAQAIGDSRKLGEILRDGGAVAEADIDEALKVQEAKKAARKDAAAATIRVDVDLLDNLMNLVGELVLARNQIVQVTGEKGLSDLADTSQRLNLITTELQEGVMKTRMQPIGNVFGKFPRVVRDIALQLGKKVSITMEGTDTELDKTIIEAIKDPLTHMVRNCVDHGIESPEDRVAAGKAETGEVHLRAYHEGGQVNIEIVDDGKGIDPSIIAAKAVERGVVTSEQVDRMTERELVNLVFAPGLSTAEAVSNLSGRGVGMDVVRTSIERIGGSVDVTSQVGQGTVTKLKIPLTLAIIPALIVTAAEDRFAIPQVSLLELLRVDAEEVAGAIEHVNGTPLFRLRGRLLPLVHLEEVLGLPRRERRVYHIVVLQADSQQFGLVVDAVNDSAEIVVRPLGHLLRHVSAYAGATIMGDGQVALILDAMGLAASAGITEGGHHLELVDGGDEVAEDVESLLLFNLDPDGTGSSATRMAVPLSQIVRLEKLDATTIEAASGTPVVQYRGTIMPLVWLTELLVGFRPPLQSDELHVIVHEQGDRRIGFVVDAFTDVLDAPVSLERPSDLPGVRGSALIGGNVTDVVDIHHIVATRFPTHALEVAS